MPNYQVILEDVATSTLFNLLPNSYSFIEKINSEPSGEFSFSYKSLNDIAKKNNTTVEDLLTSGLKNVFVYRDGVKILDSVIDDIEINPEGGGNLSVSIKTIGIFGLFSKRFVGVPVRRFVTTDAGTIAWTMISESQSSNNPYSDLGVTLGTIQASKNRTRSYYFDEIRQSIINLSNENLAVGFDFEINNSRQFNAYYPKKGQDRPNIILKNTNVIEFSWSKRITRGLTNRVYVTGEGQNEDVLYTQRDATNAHKAVFGLMEDKQDEADVSEIATLEDKGDSVLSKFQASEIFFNNASYNDSSIGWDEFNLGDSVKVDYQNLGLDKEYKRVISREFVVGSIDGVATVNVELI